MSFISLTFWSISFILIAKKDPLVRFTGEPAPGADMGLFSMITSYKVSSLGTKLGVPFLSSALFLSNGNNSFLLFPVYMRLSNRLYRLPRQDSHRIDRLITLFFIDDSQLFLYSRDRRGKIVTGRALRLLYRR